MKTSRKVVTPPFRLAVRHMYGVFLLIFHGQAAIDGQVLTAMTTADWKELSAMSPVGCRPQLSGIGVAAQRLLYQATSSRTVPLKGNLRSSKPQTDGATDVNASDVEGAVHAVAGSATANHNNPPRARVEIGDTEDDILPQKDREAALPKLDVTRTVLGVPSAANVPSTSAITPIAGVTACRTPTERSTSTLDFSTKLGRGSSENMGSDADVKANQKGDRISRESSYPSCRTAPTDLDFTEHTLPVNFRSGSARPLGDFISNGTPNAAKLTPASPSAIVDGRTMKSSWNDLAQNEFWSDLESEVGSSPFGSDTDDGRHVLLQ